ncbi:xanthine dehydrogenase molybdopterin binding subunit [Variovorax sp. PCZ-1]|uniref:xanthine dehydrogenase molybdopterin binding subunit n=1 Tax=Variovorax sp. PCZ-1 TaxID=2835533 RepID=UPI001BCE47B3|nr:xanthine dehydrogenase molybdopterin binding subunit [Variovorax sp. PCZ-1]MBS7808975.1 xanthine dehydrogenase molybdopterin binding subunit [Variovorax sp. PCZ-1]
MSAGLHVAHESAKAQVQGAVRYVDDIPELQGTLHAAPVMSRVAHGRVRGLDFSAALALPGVRGIVTAQDIPGDPILGAFAHDEPIFASELVQHVGNVMALIVAADVMTARRAARLVKADIEELPAILSTQEALEKNHFVLPPVHVRRGDADTALQAAPHRLNGSFSVGGQEHFYLEGQVAYAQPQEMGQWLIHSSTQHPGEVQHWVAHALKLNLNDVRVETRRMGGGFGGKETQAGHLAVWSALAALKFGAPVKLRLDRDDDFMITGKRHPFDYDYEVGFDETGLLSGLKVSMRVNCGFSADLSGPVADRAIFHLDNAYFLQDVSISSYRCKTHTQSHTAFRGFGGPQGMMVIETIMGDIARHLKRDPLAVRMRNLYDGASELIGVRSELISPTSSNTTKLNEINSALTPINSPNRANKAKRNTTHYGMPVEDNILHALLSKLEHSAQYIRRRDAINTWNSAQTHFKRGISITPVKFGISFTATLFNQAGALVHVYTDGSVQINHGGTEMGQGLHTKIAQIVAHELGIPYELIRATASDTSKIPNASATAASAGTDLNGRAAQFAARSVRDKLAAFVSGLDGCGAGAVSFKDGQVISPSQSRPWQEVVGLAYANRIQLWSDGFYATPKIHYDKKTLSGRPFYYFAYGAACTEVIIDTRAGESRILKVDILHDVGRSINPTIDIGQIEGAFVQGMGWLTTEQLVWNDKGHLSTHAPSTYKIPATGCIPEHFKVDLWPEANREDNIFGSKAVGEPPFMLAISVWEAYRDAISSAGGDTSRLNAPCTAENVLRCLSSFE